MAGARLAPHVRHQGPWGCEPSPQHCRALPPPAIIFIAHGPLQRHTPQGQDLSSSTPPLQAAALGLSRGKA
jgi:hypothetical protein